MGQTQVKANSRKQFLKTGKEDVQEDIQFLVFRRGRSTQGVYGNSGLQDQINVSHARGDTHGPRMCRVCLSFVGGLTRFHLDFICAAVTGGGSSEVFNFTNNKCVFTKIVNLLLSNNVTVTL